MTTIDDRRRPTDRLSSLFSYCRQSRWQRYKQIWEKHQQTTPDNDNTSATIMNPFWLSTVYIYKTDKQPIHLCCGINDIRDDDSFWRVEMSDEVWWGVGREGRVQTIYEIFEIFEMYETKWEPTHTSTHSHSHTQPCHLYLSLPSPLHHWWWRWWRYPLMKPDEEEKKIQVIYTYIPYFLLHLTTVLFSRSPVTIFASFPSLPLTPLT